MVYGAALHNATDAAYSRFAREQAANGVLYPVVLYLSSAWVFDKLCDAASGMCGPTVPGAEAFAWRDEWHLSTAGSMHLAPFFHCFLSEHGVI